MEIVKRAVLLIVLVCVPLTAQAPNPSALPLVQASDLVIAGAIRVPDDFNYGGQIMAFNPAGSLFLGHRNGVAEVTLPAPVLGAIADMPRATLKQPFADVTSGRWKDAGPTPADTLGGLIVHEGRLIGNAFVFYDANNTQERSHFSHSLTLTDATSFRGWSRVGAVRQSGFVAGPMTPIPPEWQPALGGNAVTGQCCLSIITRSSFGPAAFSIDLSKVGEPAVPATPLVMYPGDHPALGPWNGSNPTYGGTTQIGGMVIVPGTRSMLFLGSNGRGPFCYGEGTADKSLDGRPAPGGEKYCYDPISPDKGQHAYPYSYQIWAYDLNDLAAVKAGRKRPWQVLPYGVWPLKLPMPETQIRLSAVTIDPAARRIYAAQYKGEPYSGGGGGPLIWSIDVKIGSSAPARLR